MTPSATPSVGEDKAALLEALRMLDAMRQENRDLAGQVGYFQARAQVLDERIRMLEAPKPDPEPAPAEQSFNRLNTRRLVPLARALAALALVVMAAAAWVR